jgi:hypothetical protein
MFRITRKRLAGISSALTIVLALVLATTASAGGPVAHHVSAGGPDACVAFGFEHPGCDGNFSLTAIEYADGSMSGQYTDRFAQGDGFHAVIDCVSVVGNEAWVSGVITQGTFTDPDTGNVFDLTGLPVATRVRDNGTSANDPADQISFSVIGEGFAVPCTEHPLYDLFDAPEGQVTIK